MNKIRLVVSEGRLMPEHETTFNEEQIGRFHDVIHWYEKATEKIARRYAKGIKQEKEARYAKVIATAISETRDIEEYYELAIKGKRTIEDFKEKVGVWFFKVRDGMNEVDRAARKAKEPWCDYEEDE